MLHDGNAHAICGRAITVGGYCSRCTITCYNYIIYSQFASADFNTGLCANNTAALYCGVGITSKVHTFALSVDSCIFQFYYWSIYSIFDGAIHIKTDSIISACILLCFQSCSIQIYSDAVGFLTILIDKNWCPAAQCDIAIYIDNTVICIRLIGRTLNKDCAEIGTVFFNSARAIYCQFTMSYTYSLVCIGQRMAIEIQRNVLAIIKSQTLGRIFQQFNCIGASNACIRNSVSQRIVIGSVDLSNGIVCALGYYHELIVVGSFCSIAIGKVGRFSRESTTRDGNGIGKACA